MLQLNEYESKKLLSDNGIKIPRGMLARTRDEARNIAASIGTRSVMKLVSKDIVHKSDGGYVYLNIDYHDAPTIYDELIAKAAKVGATVDGILVEEMCSGYELIVGLKQDPQFGLVIMVGFGGIYAEVYKDVSFRLAPITVDDAREMLRELKGHKILTGIRGKEPADINEITDVIVKVSNLKNVIELDINPLLCSAEKAVAVDARSIIL